VTAIAFIGLGAMGLPMARNLAQRQFRLCGFDQRPEARRRLAEAGGTIAASAAEAARDADMAILMVVNSDQAADVLFKSGVAEALRPGALVLLMATCAPDAVRLLAARLAEYGHSLLDAPVSGGVGAAEAASLTIMCAAPPSAYDRARPVLEALGTKVFHVGDVPGQGATVKTINQLLCGVHIAAAAEALAMAQKAGLDGRLLLPILGGSAAASWMLANRGPRMLEADPPVASAVDIFVKDLGIVVDAAKAAKVAIPLAAAAHQMFIAASANGLGGADDSQVIVAYRRLAGIVDDGQADLKEPTKRPAGAPSS
jgi:putative dehydrogenase